MTQDYNRLCLGIVKKAVRTPFKKKEMFRLELERQPDDMDIFVKDISFGPTELENEPVKAGGRVLTYPTGAAPVSLSVTVRDHEDERVARFFDEWAAEVSNSDGTFNLPYGTSGYVRKVKRFSLFEEKPDLLTDEWEMYPVQRGDVAESVEEPGFLEFPLTFVQFRS